MPAPSEADAHDPCARTLRQLSGLQLHLHLQVCTDSGAEATVPAASGRWVEAADVQQPDREPLAGLMALLADTTRADRGRAGTAHGSCRRLASASFLLRFGWAAGFAIASYLALGRVPLLHGYTLLFSPSSLLHTVRLRQVSFLEPAGNRQRLRQQLFTSLWQLGEPAVAAQHAWSRYSRHALWSMVASSWGALFSSFGRQLGDASWGISEAYALFALQGELARAAPELYEVWAGDSACTCQRRAACCLYFKASSTLCASCPLVPENERLERNRIWVRDRRPLVSG